MYQNLLNGAKRRILQEVENAFLDHPQFAGKVIVSNRFPNAKERIQYGVILRNTYASQIRMSPDNYLADLTSHVNLARLVAPQDSTGASNFPGVGIEWVRENTNFITDHVTEDLSSQVGSTQLVYHTGQVIVSGPGNTEYADNPGLVGVTVKINGLVKKVSLVSGGSGYEKGLKLTTGGTGSGCTILVTSVSGIGEITGIDIETGGTNPAESGLGYTLNDLLIIKETGHEEDLGGKVRVDNIESNSFVETQISSVDGRKKEIILRSPPAAGSTLLVSYWKRILASPGIFRIEFTADNELQIHPLYTVDGEVLFEKTTGLETTAQLEMSPFVSTPPPALYPNSDKLLLYHVNATKSDFPIKMIRDVDYSITGTGLVTFLHPVLTDFKMVANYRYLHPGMVIGPYTFKEYTELHEGIPGVVLCVGRRAKKGDWQVVNVSQFREPQARIFGGHWDMFMTLAVISKDNRQVEEMVDQIINWLWCVKKNQLEFEGITLTRVEPTGESEESFNDTATEFYYESTIDISVMTEWQRFIPYLSRIEHFSINEQVYMPDTRPVIKYPAAGYERES